MVTPQPQPQQFSSAAKRVIAAILCIMCLASASAQQTPAPAKQLILSPSWNTPMQGGSATMDDLAKLFGSVTTANTSQATDDTIQIYPGITYLDPLRSAVAALKLEARPPSKVLVACPGFPKDSFYSYAFDGRFEGSFNRLYIVVDRADQVVGLQFVEEAPRSKSDLHRDQGWRCYNFVNARTRATDKLIIGHRLSLWTVGKWTEPPLTTDYAPKITKTNTNWKCARVDSILAQLDPKNPTWPNGLATKEVVRWYVPRPVVELILTCVQQRGR